MRHTAPADAATSQPVADDLPAWDLSDLYPGPDSPALQADFAKAEQAAKAFYAAHQGKLANMSGGVAGGCHRGVRAHRGDPRAVDVIRPVTVLR